MVLAMAERHEAVNAAIGQVRRRSIYTVLAVVTGSICLFLFGAEPLQMFSLAILLGLMAVTASSLCLAPRLWVTMADHRETVRQANLTNI